MLMDCKMLKPYSNMSCELDQKLNEENNFNDQEDSFHSIRSDRDPFASEQESFHELSAEDVVKQSSGSSQLRSFSDNQNQVEWLNRAVDRL